MALFASALLLAACARPYTVHGSGATPAALAQDLRDAGVLIVAPPRANVTAFHGAVRKVHGGPDSLASFVAGMLLDSLNRGRPNAVARRASFRADSLTPASDLAAAARDAGARYVVQLRSVTVGRSVRELPVMTLPTHGDALGKSGGGSSESVVVSLEIAVWDVEALEQVAAPRHLFVVSGSSEVFLWAVKTSLRRAVRYAAQGAAAQLRAP